MTYESYATVTAAHQVIVDNLPLQAGQRVKVIIQDTIPEPPNRAELIQRWQALFKETQALPQAATLTDDDIANEIAA